MQGFSLSWPVHYSNQLPAVAVISAATAGETEVAPAEGVLIEAALAAVADTAAEATVAVAGASGKDDSSIERFPH